MEWNDGAICGMRKRSDVDTFGREDLRDPRGGCLVGKVSISFSKTTVCPTQFCVTTINPTMPHEIACTIS